MGPVLLLFALSATDPASAAAAPKEKDPMVCTRRRDIAFGSHMSKPRVCKRKSEWDAEARAARRELDQLNQRGMNPAEVPGGRPPQ